MWGVYECEGVCGWVGDCECGVCMSVKVCVCDCECGVCMSVKVCVCGWVTVNVGCV